MVAAFGEAFVARHEPELRRRARLGLARDGHGDLRCEHVLLAGPTVRVVNRIEFDPRLRRTDVACDLAFLAMDLEARGQRWAARELIGAYRHAGISPGGEALRSFYAVHWALVRAKVTLIAAAAHDGGKADADVRAAGAKLDQEAQQLWSLSERLCWRARAPLAIVICGPAASGKSTLAADSHDARRCRSCAPTSCASDCPESTSTNRRAPNTTALGSHGRPTSTSAATRCSSCAVPAA